MMNLIWVNRFLPRLFLILLLFNVSLWAQELPSPIEEMSNMDRVNELINKSNFFFKTNSDSALFYADKSLLLAEQLKVDSLITHALYAKGLIHYYRNELHEAEEIFLSAETYAINVQQSKLLSEIYRVLGILYNRLGLKDIGLNYYFLAIESSLIDIDKASIKINIASAYLLDRKYELAETLLKESLTFFETKEDSIMKIENLFQRKDFFNYKIYNYIFLLRCSSNLEEVEFYRSKAIENIKRGHEFRFESYYGALNAYLGEKYIELKKFSEAEEAFSLSLEYSKPAKLNDISSVAYYGLGLTSLIQNKYNRAKSFLDSISSSNVSELAGRKKNVDSLYYEIYKAQGEFETAAEYLERCLQYLYKQLTDKSTNKYIEYGKMYETEKKIQENLLLKKQNEIQSIELENQKNRRNFLITLIAVFVLALLLLFVKVNAKNKMVKQLNKTKDLIDSQRKALEKSNLNKRRLFEIVAHDLVNPFNAVLGFAQLLEQSYEDYSKTEVKRYISLINEYAYRNYKLTKSLLNWAKQNQEHLVATVAELSVRDVVDLALKPNQILVEQKMIDVVVNVPESLKIEADLNMMRTVISNIFVNAVKFSPVNGKIEIVGSIHNTDKVFLKIKDNGSGIEEKKLEGIFNTTKFKSSKKEFGLGLPICKELMEMQGGSIEITSEKNVGTEVSLSINSLKQTK